MQIIANGAQWGRGTITIQDQGSLELIGVELFVSFAVEPGTSALSMRDCEVISQTPLIVPAGSNVTMRVDRTTIGVVRTVDTFSSFQFGIAVDGELTMHALDLFWGSNVYVGIWVAEAGHLSCAQCSMDMTPLGMLVEEKRRVLAQPPTEILRNLKKTPNLTRVPPMLKTPF
eukprot:SAG31_NODE_12389_length_945_cov_1.861702_2_plen_172_part_00